MSENFTFPVREQAVVVETGLMAEVHKLTLAAHNDGGLVLWTGLSRMGKTTAARVLVHKILEAYDPSDPDAFRARYYEVGGDVQRASQRVMKRGVKSLYWQVIGPIDDKTYYRLPEEALAEMVVEGLCKRQIQMVFVDEAGSLSLEEIRGMVLVSDIAQHMGWPLTLVLIGMDDLPQKVERLPQIRGRIQSWCYFEPYDLDDTWTLLTRMSPHFARLDGRKVAHRAQVEFVHQEFGGVVGRMVPFLRRLALRMGEAPEETVDLLFLKAVAADMQLSRDRSIEASTHRYRTRRRSTGTDDNRQGDAAVG